MRYRVVEAGVFQILFSFLVFLSGVGAMNYVILSVTKDGLMELRLAIRGRLLLETSLIDPQSKESLVYSRATDGIRVVELVIRYGAVDDCAVSSSYKDVLAFSTEHSQVWPGKMEDSETDIMDVYLGLKKITDPIFLSRHSKSNRHGTFHSNVTFIQKDESLQEDSTLESFAYSKDFRLSVKITSVKSSTFVRRLKSRLQVRKNARDCRRFMAEATRRLEMLSALVQQDLGDESQQDFTDESSTPAGYISKAAAHSEMLRDFVRLQGHHQNLSHQNSETSGNFDEVRGEYRSFTAVSLPLNNSHINDKITSQVDLPPSISISSKSETEIVLKNLTLSSLSSTSSLSTRQNNTEDIVPQTTPLTSLRNISLSSTALLSTTDSSEDNLNHKKNDGASNKSYSSLQSPVATDFRKRSKRDLLQGWMIFPGTKWCGDGDIAEHKKDLGYHAELDKCCRRHDLCPLVIPRLSWKYGVFNYRLHTLCHCRCDRKFRKCLKASTSPLAHLIGQIYFNVIGPQCFKFTQKMTCIQRQWWGGCSEWADSKVAQPKKQRMFK